MSSYSIKPRPCVGAFFVLTNCSLLSGSGRKPSFCWCAATGNLFVSWELLGACRVRISVRFAFPRQRCGQNQLPEPHSTGFVPVPEYRGEACPYSFRTAPVSVQAWKSFGARRGEYGFHLPRNGSRRRLLGSLHGRGEISSDDRGADPGYAATIVSGLGMRAVEFHACSDVRLLLIHNKHA